MSRVSFLSSHRQVVRQRRTAYRNDPFMDFGRSENGALVDRMFSDYDYLPSDSEPSSDNGQRAHSAQAVTPGL